MGSDRAFISWHLCQRSRSLATRLQIPLLETQPEGPAILRFPLCILWTVFVLFRYQPTRVIVQYSYLLLVVLVIYKKIRLQPVVLIADCHTKGLRRRIDGPLARLFDAVKDWSFAHTDLCLVHNPELVPDLRETVRHHLVLADPLPERFHALPSARPDAGCVFVCSYDVDEPVDTIVDAALELVAELPVFMTGRAPAAVRERAAGRGVTMTGYLSDTEYAALISAARVIVSLTTESACLQCAGYEALSAGVPFVTSDTSALRALLGDAAVFVENDAAAIVSGVRVALSESDRLVAAGVACRKNIESEVDAKLEALARGYLGSEGSD